MYDNLTSVIILRPQSNLTSLSYQAEETTFRDTMSSIGGLIGIVGSIIGFLFGAAVLSPWGFVAGLPWFRRRISGSLAKAYDSADGLSKGPFTTKIDEIGQFDPTTIPEQGTKTMSATEMKIILLKERLDELELVLSEFYLDGKVFKSYADEREKIKLERAVSRRGNVSGGGEKGKRGLLGLRSYKSQQQQQEYSAIEGDGMAGMTESGEMLAMSSYPAKQEFQDTSSPSSTNWMLSSHTLMENQHQHQGSLPSMAHPPQVPTSSASSSEPGVFTYYQQQQLNQHIQGQQQPQQQHHDAQHAKKTASAQSLVRPMAGGDPSAIRIPPRRSSFNEQDAQQAQSLLQQDSLRNSMTTMSPTTPTSPTHGGLPPTYPARPQRDEILPITTTASPYTGPTSSQQQQQQQQQGKWFASTSTTTQPSVAPSPTLTSYSGVGTQQPQPQHQQQQQPYQPSTEYSQQGSSDVSRMIREF
ncbi:hypothetical protein BGZ83_005088 [Gryganskiella cystojenkinii]|nr:hypothetical protein BGZ83_005088 [Gryganskiella cystojenkinii]